MGTLVIEHQGFHCPTIFCRIRKYLCLHKKDSFISELTQVRVQKRAMAPKATDTVVPKVKILTHGKLKLKKLFKAGSSASKEKEEKPLSKKELAAKKKVI